MQILVYIPTTISLCNHMSQFKSTLCPVVLLAHVGQLLPKLSITDMYVYCIFVESLRYKVLILFVPVIWRKYLIDINYFAI